MKDRSVLLTLTETLPHHCFNSISKHIHIVESILRAKQQSFCYSQLKITILANAGVYVESIVNVVIRGADRILSSCHRVHACQP